MTQTEAKSRRWLDGMIAQSAVAPILPWERGGPRAQMIARRNQVQKPQILPAIARLVDITSQPMRKVALG